MKKEIAKLILIAMAFLLGAMVVDDLGKHFFMARDLTMATILIFFGAGLILPAVILALFRPIAGAILLICASICGYLVTRVFEDYISGVMSAGSSFFLLIISGLIILCSPPFAEVARESERPTTSRYRSLKILLSLPMAIIVAIKVGFSWGFLLAMFLNEIISNRIGAIIGSYSAVGFGISAIFFFSMLWEIKLFDSIRQSWQKYSRFASVLK